MSSLITTRILMISPSDMLGFLLLLMVKNRGFYSPEKLDTGHRVAYMPFFNLLHDKHRRKN